MNRHLALVFAASACACSSDPSTGRTSDAGTPPLADATSTADAAAAPDAETAAPDAEAADLGVSADAGAEDAAPADTGTSGPTFSADIFPMFEQIGCNRVACHGSLRAQGGAVVYLPEANAAYADLFERPSIREPKLLVDPGDPEDSVLYTHGRDANIPAGDLTPEGLDLIGEWITGGAPFGDPVAITTLPPQPTCSLADRPGTPPLPPACMPRCSRETWDGVIACRNEPDVGACQVEVIGADTSTVVDLDFGPDLGTFPLDCGSCLDFQTETCFVEHCLAEYLAAVRCQALDPRPTACGMETDRALACASASLAFRSCQASRDVLCVAP